MEEFLSRNVVAGVLSGLRGRTSRRIEEKNQHLGCFTPNLLPSRVERYAPLIEQLRGKAVPFSQHAQEQVPGPKELGRKVLGFLGGVDKYPLAFVTGGKIDGG